jgi:hypothetical protein
MQANNTLEPTAAAPEFSCVGPVHRLSFGYRRLRLSWSFAAEKMRRRMQRRTVRMSLASSARRHLCTGRRAYSACASRHHAPRPLVAAQYGSFGRLPSGEPGGWSRPDFGHLCYRSLRRPAAHPHR